MDEVQKPNDTEWDTCFCISTHLFFLVDCNNYGEYIDSEKKVNLDYYLNATKCVGLAS
jgi:hypothetical protein